MSGVTRARGKSFLVILLAALAAAGLYVARKRESAPAQTAIRGPLAVMYFENLGDDADTDRLGIMMTHLLTAELSRMSGVQVISRQRLQAVELEGPDRRRRSRQRGR